MRVIFGFMLLSFALFFEGQACAQQSQIPDEVLAKLKTNAIEMDRQFSIGAMVDEDKIIPYVQTLIVLDRAKDGFDVLKKSLESAYVEKSAENMRLAANLLMLQNKQVESIPYLQDAIELGDRSAQTQLAIAYVEQSKTSGNRDCRFLETEITKAIDVGMPVGGGMMVIGHCYSETAKVKMAPDCKPGIRASQYSKMSKETRADIKTAKSFFKQVPKNAPQYRDAQNWLFVIKSQPTIKQYLCGEIGGDPE